MQMGVDHRFIRDKAKAPTIAKQRPGTIIATAIEERSETRPMITGRMAPPMIDITSSEDPSLASGPSPFSDKAKMVGNMIDMKKLVAIIAPRPTQPPAKAPIRQSPPLRAAKSAVRKA